MLSFTLYSSCRLEIARRWNTSRRHNRLGLVLVDDDPAESETDTRRKNGNMALANSWSRTVAVGALLVVWLVWSVNFLRPGMTDNVLAKLPSLSSTGSSSATKDDLRPLVLYSYAESENARENLAFFIRNALNGRADFVFIFNGETDAPDLLPKLPNIRIVQRENKCFDIGAHGEVLRTDDMWKNYKRFIMMNASVRGPFMPTYVPGCWMDAFLGKITDTVKVRKRTALDRDPGVDGMIPGMLTTTLQKLVGTTLNCHPRVHLQSMLLATDDIGLSVLLDPELALSAADDNFYGTHNDAVGLSPCFTTMHKAVHAEIGLMSLIESQGYTADVVMTAPHSAATFDQFCDNAGRPDDFLYKDSYLGTTVHPYETIFMKANRDIDPMALTKLTEWHLAANMTSWDTCGR